MTPLRVSLLAAIVSLLFLVFVLELIRRRRLNERYAMLWLLTAFVSLVLSLWRGGLTKIADAFGIAYPPSALFVLVSLFLLVLLLHYSTVLSTLTNQNRILAQRLALLQDRFDRLEERQREAAREPLPQ